MHEVCVTDTEIFLSEKKRIIMVELVSGQSRLDLTNTEANDFLGFLSEDFHSIIILDFEFDFAWDSDGETYQVTIIEMLRWF